MNQTNSSIGTKYSTLQSRAAAGQPHLSIPIIVHIDVVIVDYKVYKVFILCTDSAVRQSLLLVQPKSAGTTNNME